MSLINITPKEDDGFFELPVGKLGSNNGVKMNVIEPPIDIDAKKGHSIVAYDFENYITFKSICSAAKFTGKSKQAISQAARGVRPTCYGYFWRYV